MQLQNENQYYNLKFKDLSKRQKIRFVAFVIFTLALIIFLCVFADNIEVKTRKTIGLAILSAFAVFLLADMVLLVWPDKNQRNTGIINYNAYLFNFDFEVLPPVYTKKTCEIIFTDNSEICISFIRLKKKFKSQWNAYFVCRNFYVPVYSLYAYFFAKELSEAEAAEFKYPDFPDLVTELLNFRKENPEEFYGILNRFIFEEQQDTL